jgi:dihydropyrimidinase
MYDLLVKNGLVATEYNVLPLDVAVQDEKIVALSLHGTLDEVNATHVIDAQGKYVLPGGIDPHVHYDISISEAMTAQTPVAGSRAGLYGGTTTYIDFSLQAGEESLLESIQDKIDHTAAQNPHADYALHAIMSGDWPLQNAEMMAEAISGGVISFKFFTTFKGSPSIGGLMSDDGRIYCVLPTSQRESRFSIAYSHPY